MCGVLVIISSTNKKYLSMLLGELMHRGLDDFCIGVINNEHTL